MFSVAWAPLLVLLHELGHALAALALTKGGEVSIELRSVGLEGGSATYEGLRLRRARDAAWIAAAGPAVSLVAAAVLWFAFAKDPSFDDVTVLFVGAWVATGHFLASAVPVRYGAGLGGPADSDGRVVWRVLTGAPPGGLESELRRLGKREPSVRPVFVVLIVLLGALSIAADPVLGLVYAGLFGGAALLQRSDKRR